MESERREGYFNIYSFLEYIQNINRDGAYVFQFNSYTLTAYVQKKVMIHASLAVDDRIVLQGGQVFQLEFKKVRGVLDFFEGLLPNTYTMNEAVSLLLERMGANTGIARAPLYKVK